MPNEVDCTLLIIMIMIIIYHHIHNFHHHHHNHDDDDHPAMHVQIWREWCQPIARIHFDDACHHRHHHRCHHHHRRRRHHHHHWHVLHLCHQDCHLCHHFSYNCHQSHHQHHSLGRGQVARFSLSVIISLNSPQTTLTSIPSQKTGRKKLRDLFFVLREKIITSELFILWNCA